MFSRKADKLESLSCTDKTCEWKQVHSKALENYEVAPLMQHSCFAQPVKVNKLINALSVEECYKDSPKVSEVVMESQCNEDCNGLTSQVEKKRKVLGEISVSHNQLNEIKNFIVQKLPTSALAKHS